MSDRHWKATYDLARKRFVIHLRSNAGGFFVSIQEQTGKGSSTICVQADTFPAFVAHLEAAQGPIAELIRMTNAARQTDTP